MSTAVQDFLPQVQRAVTKYGETVSWEKVIRVENQDQQWKPDVGSDSTKLVQAVFVRNGTSIANVFQSYLKGTDIPQSSMKAYVLPIDGWRPSLADKVTRDGKVLTVSTVDQISPNSIVVCWIVTFNA